MRQCKKCLQYHEESFFYDKKNRLGNVRKMYTCKDCYKEQVATWRLSNPEANFNINRRSRYKGVYGVDANSVPKQGYCPICQREDVRVVVDHCHSEKHVRGLICYACNTLLGSLEKKDKLGRAFSYLEGKLEDPKALTLRLLRSNTK